ncbi:MAG TPA: hypothetical protein VJ642_07975 [Chromobacteriaceae bacterium]|nr:hypothetical protein [Chromobacteriaceae bacterium]
MKHQHLTMATYRAPRTLLSMSAWQRLLLVLLALSALWLVVVWALQEVA